MRVGSTDLCRERGREGERERGREGERERGREGERKRGREGEREREEGSCLFPSVAAATA